MGGAAGAPRPALTGWRQAARDIDISGVGCGRSRFTASIIAQQRPCRKEMAPRKAL